MACNCAQGYSQPAVNRSPCGCQEGYSGPRPYGLGRVQSFLAPPVITRRPGRGLGRPYGMAYSLGGPPMPLMGRLGAITQQMKPIAPGGAFSFGFQESTIRNPWTDETTFAGYLEDAGLSYNTESHVLTGHLNPYVVINGNSLLYWDSATDLGYQIQNALQQKGVPIDTSVVNFQAEPYDPNAAGALPMEGLQGAPGGGGGGNGASGCPPGTYDASVLHGLFGLDCRTGAPPSGFSWSTLLGAGGGGLILGVGAVVALLFLSKR